MSIVLRKMEIAHLGDHSPDQINMRINTPESDEIAEEAEIRGVRGPQESDENRGHYRYLEPLILKAKCLMNASIALSSVGAPDPGNILIWQNFQRLR